jgi:hypothetical protein
MDRIEHLKTTFLEFQNDEDIVRKQINDEIENKKIVLPGLKGTNAMKALYAVYIQNNIDYAKQCYCNYAEISVYMSEKYDRRVIDTGINDISYALLSDNIDLIQRFSRLKNTINAINSFGYQLPNVMQNILLNNDEKLLDNIRDIKRFVKLPRFAAYVPTVEVLNGFVNHNAEEIKVGLEGLLKTHRKRNNHPLISRFFSIDTAGLCKLAWIKGFEINLSNELVPQALMPCKPLDNYIPYEFLED